MFSKSFFGAIIICLTGLSFFACNSSVKKETSNTDERNLVIANDSFAIYENMLLKDSSNISLRTLLAKEYYAAKKYNNAISHFTTIYNYNNKNLTALINLGNLYYDTELYDKAIEFYKKALVIDNTNTNVRCDMATCYLNIKEPKTALALLKENIKMDNNHKQSHHNLSVVYTELGMTKEAEEETAIFDKLSAK